MHTITKLVQTIQKWNNTHSNHREVKWSTQYTFQYLCAPSHNYLLVVHKCISQRTQGPLECLCTMQIDQSAHIVENQTASLCNRCNVYNYYDHVYTNIGQLHTLVQTIHNLYNCTTNTIMHNYRQLHATITTIDNFATMRNYLQPLTTIVQLLQPLTTSTTMHNYCNNWQLVQPCTTTATIDN